MYCAKAQTAVPYDLPQGKTYHVVAPPSAPKGLILLFPDFNQSTRQLLSETEIEELAYIHGVATAVIPCGPKLYADREVVKLINQVVDSVSSNYQFSNEKVIIGGIGAGGTIALRYTAYCLTYPDDYFLRPKAVFAVDAAVDLEVKYESLQRELQHNGSSNGIEAELYLEIMNRELGGSPADKAYRYQGLSPFNRHEPKGGNATQLQTIPVRLYYDLDINWQLKQHHRSLYDMNVLAGSEMIKQLLLNGNHHADLIINSRNDSQHPNKRNPLISIVDDIEWTEWVMNTLQIPIHQKATISK